MDTPIATKIAVQAVPTALLILYILYKEGLTKFLTKRNGHSSEGSFTRLWKLEVSESISLAFEKSVNPVIERQTVSIIKQTDVLAEILVELRAQSMHSGVHEWNRQG